MLAMMPAVRRQAREGRCGRPPHSPAMTAPTLDALPPSSASPRSPRSNPDAPATPTAGVLWSRWGALALCAALLLLGLGWELAWAPTGRGSLALKVLPLALALPGLWRMRLYTYRWLALAVWLYVTEGVVRATSQPGGLASLGAQLAAAEVLLALLLFGACAAHVRLRLASGRARLAAEPKAPV